MVGEVFIRFKDPPPSLHAGHAPSGGSCSTFTRTERASDCILGCLETDRRHCFKIIVRFQVICLFSTQ